MPHRICPHCGKTGRFLEEITKVAFVEYYRCDACHQVWTHRKHDPDAPPQIVTVQPNQRNAQ